MNDATIHAIGEALKQHVEKCAFFVYPIWDKCAQKMQYDVYYAVEHPEWSCVVILLQGIGGHAELQLRGVNFEAKTITLYTLNNPTIGAAAEGMCSFFQVDHRPVPQASGTVVDNIVMRRVEVHHDAIVGRKRLDDFTNLNLGPTPEIQTSRFDDHGTHLHRIYMALAFHRVRRKFDANEKGLAIAAVLVAANGAVRVVADNTKRENVTFHAEVNLVQAFIKNYPGQRANPFFLYSTLQPCPMCAAMIFEYLPNTCVIYGQRDPGSHMGRMRGAPTFIRQLSPAGMPGTKPLPGYDVEELGPLMLNRQYHDIAAKLDNLHEEKRKERKVSVTMNLYDPDAKHAITRASNFLERKYEQYGDQAAEGADPKWRALPRAKSPSADRIARHLAIKRIVDHIRPMIFRQFTLPPQSAQGPQTTTVAAIPVPQSIPFGGHSASSNATIIRTERDMPPPKKRPRPDSDEA